MSVNGIGAMGSPAWYGTKKADQSAVSETLSFKETVAEKAAEERNIVNDVNSFRLTLGKRA